MDGDNCAEGVLHCYIFRWPLCIGCGVRGGSLLCTQRSERHGARSLAQQHALVIRVLTELLHDGGERRRIDGALGRSAQRRHGRGLATEARHVLPPGAVVQDEQVLAAAGKRALFEDHGERCSMAAGAPLIVRRQRRRQRAQRA
jgi:hypothetical protein